MYPSISFELERKPTFGVANNSGRANIRNYNSISITVNGINLGSKIFRGNLPKLYIGFILGKKWKSLEIKTQRKQEFSVAYKDGLGRSTVNKSYFKSAIKKRNSFHISKVFKRFYYC